MAMLNNQRVNPRKATFQLVHIQLAVKLEADRTHSLVMLMLTYQGIQGWPVARSASLLCYQNSQFSELPEMCQSQNSSKFQNLQIHPIHPAPRVPAPPSVSMNWGSISKTRSKEKALMLINFLGSTCG